MKKILPLILLMLLLVGCSGGDHGTLVSQTAGTQAPVPQESTTTVNPRITELEAQVAALTATSTTTTTVAKPIVPKAPVAKPPVVVPPKPVTPTTIGPGTYIDCPDIDWEGKDTGQASRLTKLACDTRTFYATIDTCINKYGEPVADQTRGACNQSWGQYGVGPSDGPVYTYPNPEGNFSGVTDRSTLPCSDPNSSKPCCSYNSFYPAGCCGPMHAQCIYGPQSEDKIPANYMPTCTGDPAVPAYKKPAGVCPPHNDPVYGHPDTRPPPS